MKKQKIIVFSVIFLIIAFVLANDLYKNHQFKQYGSMVKKNSSSLVRDYSITKGNKNAKVQLVEFFNPACGTCAYFHPLVDKLMEQYKGNIKLILRYTPFPHDSDYVIKMLEASRKQGKFWETLNLVFNNQNIWISGHQLHPEKLWKLLPTIGINIDKLAQDMKNPEIDKIISQDLADGKKLGVNQTPEFFVNGKPLQEFGYEQLKELINSELKTHN